MILAPYVCAPAPYRRRCSASLASAREGTLVRLHPFGASVVRRSVRSVFHLCVLLPSVRRPGLTLCAYRRDVLDSASLRPFGASDSRPKPEVKLGSETEVIRGAQFDIFLGVQIHGQSGVKI